MGVSVVIQDDEDTDNDDIRDVLNPRFEQMFENQCENIFLLKEDYNMGIEEVRSILIPMGFTERSLDMYGNLI